MTTTTSRSRIPINSIAVEGMPLAVADSLRMSEIFLFVRIASEPPRSRHALPDLMQSAIASAVTFGRAS